MSHQLPCLNPAFNGAASSETFINGKILRARTMADMTAIKDPAVSAVILDASGEPAVQELRAFIACHKEDSHYLARNLNAIFLPHKSLRNYRRLLTSIFKATACNGHVREGFEFATEGGLVQGRGVRFNEHVFGKHHKYFVVAGNLGGGTGADAGIKYLLSPVTEARYRTAIEGKPFATAKADNPDLAWGELKPGEIIIYKGGKLGVQGPVLVTGGPDVAADEVYAHHEMSDEYIMVPAF